MIVFPWIRSLAVLVIVAAVLLSLRPAVRTLRSRGTLPFVYPGIVSVLLFALALLAAVLVWLVLYGPDG